MPLNSEHELILASVYDCLDHAVRRPGYRLEVAAYHIDRLMMMNVDRCVSLLSKLCYQRILGDIDRVRASREHVALHVFERVLDFCFEILDQRAAAINIERLDAKAYGKHRQPPIFGDGE